MTRNELESKLIELLTKFSKSLFLTFGEFYKTYLSSHFERKEAWYTQGLSLAISLNKRRLDSYIVLSAYELMIVHNKKICFQFWAKTSEKILDFEEFLSSQEIE